MSDYKDIARSISELENAPSVYKKWKRAADKALRKYVKNTSAHSPFKYKPGKFAFFVDPDSYDFALEICGVPPNAGRVSGVNVPINEWYEGTTAFTKPYGMSYRTTKKRMKTAASCGVPMANDVKYYGVSGQPKRFFGIKYGSHKVTVYGLVKQGEVVPVYSEEGYADWLMNYNREELERILFETGSEVLDKVLS